MNMGFKKLKFCIQKSRRMRSLQTMASKQRRSVMKVRAYLVAQEAYSLLTKNEGPLLYTAARENRKALVKGLLDIGTDPNLRGFIDCTALHEAAAHGNTEVLRLLLSYGADAMAKTSTGQTALHWAADVGHFDAVLVLLSAGSEIDSTTILGYTSLDFARSRGHHRITNLLQYYRSCSN